jgi:hypothetical protein
MARQELTKGWLPVLVKCTPGKEDGWAGSDPVQMFTSAALLKWVNSVKVAKSKNFAAERPFTFLKGIDVLKRARKLRDVKAARDAGEMLRAAFNLEQGKDQEFLASDPVQAATFSVRVFGMKALADDVRSETFISKFITEKVADVRPVYWRMVKPGLSRGQRYTALSPAMYCPDLKTAFAYTLFFKEICVCLRCHSFLLQERDNGNYCDRACRDAHRSARWRERKKIEAMPKRRQKR